MIVYALMLMGTYSTGTIKKDVQIDVTVQAVYKSKNECLAALEEAKIKSSKAYDSFGGSCYERKVK